MPSHHQSAFFQAIRTRGIDLVVHYYGDVSSKRRRGGWLPVGKLPKGERLVPASTKALTLCPDWESRIHIIPGYGSRFLIMLVFTLSFHKINWMHWSEPARPGWKWFLSYPIKRCYASMVNHRSHGALAIGEMARRDFLKWGVKRKYIYFLPYSLEGVSETGPTDPPLTEFSKQFSIVFIFVGVLNRRKGVDCLLLAFKNLISQNSSAGLALVGLDDSNGEYKKLAKLLHIDKQVFFRGVIPAKDIGKVLACAQVLVLPSRFDGWGMVINEAASAGKAIIATNTCGAAHHLIKCGENGFRIKPDNVTELADRMTLYVKQPVLAEIHGKTSRELFSAFSPEMNAVRLLKILSKCSNGQYPT